MLLEKVFKECGRDFRNYKKASLSRRISKRLVACNITSYTDYSAVLDADPSEYQRLFSSLTVKVSEFFREPEVFDLLCSIVKERVHDPGGFKAWSCGCAYGEEAYSLAVLLAECMAPADHALCRVYATDIDNDAVEQARKGIYREDSLANVSDELKEKYFIRTDGMRKVKYSIRNIVRFGVLDIVRSPAIARVDMLLCRNLFIYFNKALQEKIFSKLDYSLKPGGILVLGKAEVLPASAASAYAQIAGGMNVYRKNA